MPAEFAVPEPHGDRGWKLKIRDRERVEPPHVTLIFKRWSWRFGLREGEFLDLEPDPDDVPSDLLDHLRRHIHDYAEVWDRMYPENPVPADRRKETSG